MVEDDVLLRQIGAMVRALARWLRGDTPVDVRQAEMDRLSTSTFGLDLTTLRRIPPAQLSALMPAHAPGGPTRWVLAARLLVVAAQDESSDHHSTRATQALGFVEAALATGLPIHEPTLAATLAAIGAMAEGKGAG